MRGKFSFVLFVLSLLSFQLATPQAKAQSDTIEAQREFLFNLGFNDVPAIIQERLNRKAYLTELNRRQMEANVIAYEVINASRELALLILNDSNLDRSQLDSAKAKQLSLLAAKMLALKPLAPATDYPSEILSMSEGKAKEEALVNWLHDQRVEQMNAQKNRILSDLVSVLYDKNVDANSTKIRRIDKLLTTVVERMYMDDTIGNGKYFGRALTALLLREEKLSGDKQSTVTKTISEELTGRYNLYLENFFGDTMTLPTPKGNKKFTVENGTMMLTRNLSAGSLQISFAAVPKGLYDRWRARFKGIIGTPLAGPLFVNPEDTKNGINLWMRVRDRIAQGGILREGYSHIVYFEIKEDAATGIKMPRVIDNYPNRVFDTTGEYVRTGGTRFTYPEQVIDLSHHAAVYFANPNPEKIKEWSIKSRSENGYQSEFFPSTELELDGVTPIKSKKVANWKTEISQSEFENIHSEIDAKKLSKNIWKRYAEGLEQTVYDGWTFHWPDPYDFYLIGATYCSQLGDMVMRKYVGIPLEQNTSVWHWSLRFLANIGKLGEKLKNVSGFEKIGESLLKLPSVGKAMKITGIKIISPTSLVLQPYMEGESFRFDSKSPEQREASSYMIGDYREKDPRLTSDLVSRLNLTQFTNRVRNYVLDYGAAMRDFEYGIVMRASRGIKTNGFSAEAMAEIGSQKESARLSLAPKKTECSQVLSELK